MLRATQRADPLNGQQVRAHARDACAHTVEHGRELLQVGLASRIVDRGRPLGQHGSHQDISRTRHRSLVEQHVCAPQPVGSHLIELAFGIVAEVSTQSLYTLKVCVEPAAANLVASRFRDQRPSEASHKRSDDHHRASQARTAAQEIGRLEIVQVYPVGLKGIASGSQLLHAHTHVAQQVDQVVHVEDVGHVVDRHPLGGQQRGTDHLQCLVLRPLWHDLTRHAAAALNHERAHCACCWGCLFCCLRALLCGPLAAGCWFLRCAPPLAAGCWFLRGAPPLPCCCRLR